MKHLLPISRYKYHNRLINISLVILITVYILYGLILAAFSYADFPLSMVTNKPFPYLSDKPVGEDGFYMLTVAWNIAKGYGITYNYNKLTTGIQPLNTLIYACVAWIIQLFQGDKWFFTRTVLFIGVINLLIFSHLNGIIASKLSGTNKSIEPGVYLLTFVLTLFNFGLFRIFTYGLETGLYLIFIALVINYSFGIRRFSNNYNKAIVLGILAGLTILSRIDFIIIISVFFTLSLIRRQLKFSWVMFSSIILVIVAGPWFIYVYKVTGNFIPSSGIAQINIINRYSALLRTWEFLRSIISHMMPWIYSRPSIYLSLLSLLFFVIIVFAIFRSQKSRIYIYQIISRSFFFTNWMAGIMILVFSYLITMGATHFYTRYAAPLQIFIIPIGSITIINSTRRFSNIRTTWVYIFIASFFYIWAMITLHTGVISNTQAVVAGFVNREFTSSVKVGAFQSGVVGFFNENVINLDGKVNHEVIQFLNKRSVNEYIESEKIGALVDWPKVIFKYIEKQYIEEKWEFCSNSIPDEMSICLIRKTPFKK